MLGIYAILASHFGDRGLRELIGVVAVLLAALTIAVPILHRAGRDVVESQQPPPPARFCPSCGAAVKAHGVDARCETCGARFRVTFLGGDEAPAT